MNVLVTGVGAIIGYGIVESLRLSKHDVVITGVDIFEDNYGKYVSDKFYQVPYTSSDDYLESIRSIIKKESIDIIIPGIEQDLHYFSKNRELFDTKIVLNQIQLVELSTDKYEMHKYLVENEFPNVIPTYLSMNFESATQELGLPFIVKPRKSYASKGFHVIRSKDDYEEIASEINQGTMFQPYIGSEHDEFTISVFGDGQGNYVDSLILRRYLSAAGASEKTFTIKEDNALMQSIQLLVSLFNPVGPTNFQYRKQGDQLFLLEINPRISSACSIRTKFGYNEASHCIDHYLNDEKVMIQEKKEGKAIRYISDKIIYA